MCRFTAYAGDPIGLDELLFRPEHSIIHQSYHARERREPLNGDGFGVGWYVPERGSAPALYRSVRPAWADRNMRHIAPSVRTPLFFAHVRAATDGMSVQEANCHPFVCDRLMFMHNGKLGAFKHYVRELRGDLPDDAYFQIGGTTDSEHAFAVVLDELGDRLTDPSADELAQAMHRGLERLETYRYKAGYVDEPTTANFVLTDGRSVVATRYASGDKAPASLYTSQARGFRCTGDACEALDPGASRSVLLSSERLWTDEASWRPVPDDNVVVIGADDDGTRTLDLQPIDIAF